MCQCKVFICTAKPAVMSANDETLSAQSASQCSECFQPKWTVVLQDALRCTDAHCTLCCTAHCTRFKVATDSVMSHPKLHGHPHPPSPTSCTNYFISIHIHMPRPPISSFLFTLYFLHYIFNSKRAVTMLS